MIFRHSSRGLLKENNKVLFIEYEIDGEVYYSLPGGSVETGETLKDCVVREFLEETGISVQAKSLILLNEFINPNPKAVAESWKNGIHQVESIFSLTRILEGESEVLPSNMDIGMLGTKWLGKEDLERVTYYPEMSIDWFFEEREGSVSLYKTKTYK